jgi:DNA-directed RNA polymerase subunit alpha
MLQPTFTITSQDERNDYARLVIEPLEKGYGHTLGVSLRRVLLSSIEGAAVTNVRIDNVQHQFTTLSGMKEDVVEFILNLKQLNFRLEGEDEEVTINLEAKGPVTVTGQDLKLPPRVILANPDQPLAILAEKGKIKAEITISRGRGICTRQRTASCCFR